MNNATLRTLVLELAEAVDNAAEDIGGSRPQLDILREAVAVAASPNFEPGVPAGWNIYRAGRSIIVDPPQPGEEGRLVDPDSRTPGDRILYSLANALLTATVKESLQVAQAEPFAWYVDDEDGSREYNGSPRMSNGRTGKPLYAAPLPSWQPIETAPMDDLVLLHSATRGRVPTLGRWRDYCGINQPRFSHWMGVPPGPVA